VKFIPWSLINSISLGGYLKATEAIYRIYQGGQQIAEDIMEFEPYEVVVKMSVKRKPYGVRSE